MDYEYDPEPTTFSLVARLIVMFCMGMPVASTWVSGVYWLPFR